jgi:hypothetical protein
MRYTAVVKGGMHAQYSGDISSIGALNIVDEKTRRIAQLLSNKGEVALRSVLDSLLGAAPGVLASYWVAEIGGGEELGGKRPIVQTYVVNRPTTAQDVFDIRNALTMANNSGPQATNLDRNPLGTR